MFFQKAFCQILQKLILSGQDLCGPCDPFCRTFTQFIHQGDQLPADSVPKVCITFIEGILAPLDSALHQRMADFLPSDFQHWTEDRAVCLFIPPAHACQAFHSCTAQKAHQKSFCQVVPVMCQNQ